MGQAKRRGAFEQRQAEAVDKRQTRQAELAAKHERQRQARREARRELVAAGTIGHSRVISASALVAMGLVAMNGGVRL